MINIDKSENCIPTVSISTENNISVTYQSLFININIWFELIPECCIIFPCELVSTAYALKFCPESYQQNFEHLSTMQKVCFVGVIYQQTKMKLYEKVYF